MSTHETPVQFLTTTRIGEKGQLTVPKQFRKDLGLGSGSPFAVLRLGDGLLLLPEQRRFEQLCDQIRKTLTSAGITAREALANLPQARKRVFARRYGKSSPVAPSSRPRSRRAK